MSMQPITWEDAQVLVLERMRDWVQSIAPAERGLKIAYRIPGQLGYKFLSPQDMIREVQHNTKIGQQIISAELAKIGETYGINYVIT